MRKKLENLSFCIERGKIDASAPYPPDLKGMKGASEITGELLDSGVSPERILHEGLIEGMNRVGDKFGSGAAFIPDLLIAAMAMKASMTLLKPFFETGEARHKGIVIIGTAAGDLHDIGKNIVSMVLEGNGWKVIDLGTNVSPESFLNEADKNENAVLAMSALLTTTMINMESTVALLKEHGKNNPIFIGGAPVSEKYSDKIGADGYFPDPFSFEKYISDKYSGN